MAPRPSRQRRESKGRPPGTFPPCSRSVPPRGDCSSGTSVEPARNVDKTIAHGAISRTRAGGDLKPFIEQRKWKRRGSSILEHGFSFLNPRFFTSVFRGGLPSLATVNAGSQFYCKQVGQGEEVFRGKCCPERRREARLADKGQTVPKLLCFSHFRRAISAKVFLLVVQY